MSFRRGAIPAIVWVFVFSNTVIFGLDTTQIQKAVGQDTTQVTTSESPTSWADWLRENAALISVSIGALALLFAVSKGLVRLFHGRLVQQNTELKKEIKRVWLKSVGDRIICGGTRERAWMTSLLWRYLWITHFSIGGNDVIQHRPDDGPSSSGFSGAD